MTHLSAAEFVDYAEDALDVARAAHVDGCAVCRRRGDELRASLQQLSSVKGDVPQPSPLFWDQLSARIQHGIDTADGPSVSSPSWWAASVRTLIPLTACALVIGMITIVLTRRLEAPASPPQIATAPAAIAIDHANEPWSDASTSEMWEVLTSAAADVEWDNAHETAITVAPASVDRAVQQLSVAELNELGRLLQTELKRSSD
jgi:hypothetical protein